MGLQCKDMALSRVMPRGQHLEKALDTSAVLARLHQGWVSLLVPQDGVSQRAHGVSWEILWTKAASADTGKCVVLVGCSQDARSEQSQWGLGQAGTSTPTHPLGSQFSKAPGCRQGGSGTVAGQELGTD